MTIELSPELERLVTTKAKRNGVDANAYVARVLKEALSSGEADHASERAARRETISERFEAIRQQLTPEEQQALDDLPNDFAAQHDHYIYGTPKKQS